MPYLKQEIIALKNKIKVNVKFKKCKSQKSGAFQIIATISVSGESKRAVPRAHTAFAAAIYNARQKSDFFCSFPLN